LSLEKKFFKKYFKEASFPFEDVENEKSQLKKVMEIFKERKR